MSSTRHMRGISSAPLDGQDILVHRRIVPGDGHPNYLVVFWSEEDGAWLDESDATPVDLSPESAGPVHWQPVLLIP